MSFHRKEKSQTESGKSRQFAFIGFRNEQEAQEAIKYFNNSFLDTSRITVEFAYQVDDANTPRPWSRYSLEKQGKVDKNGGESSSGNLLNGNAKGDKKKKLEDVDPDFQEFLEVTGNSKIWSNDMSIAPTAKVTTKEEVLVKKPDEPMASDGAELNKAKKRSSDTEKTKKDKVVAPSDDVSDMEYFKSRVEADGKMAQELKADSDDVLDTGRLFVRNLPYTATEEELMEHFSKFGEISEVHLVLDKETKRSKGIAFILYPIPESAARAMKELDNSIFQGRLLHILPAKHREMSDKQVNDASNLPKTFKQKREEQRKASEAGGNTKAWNSLFMRPDTILENIVRVYGISKSEFLDREAEDPAVRLALGETKVIAETKEALAKAGVNVSSLEEFAAGKGDDKLRSKHILLVKNLPFASTEKELAQMFGKFGSLDKIVLPPTKTIALVVFLEPAEARAAKKGMAYKRYKDAPLYLEWAPGNILELKTLPDNNEKKSDVGENDARRINLEQQVEIDPDITEVCPVMIDFGLILWGYLRF
uniref:RRM domain-containing protein n=1 Tax=Arabis nemorensis TaxID=586526 RepID=A0A565CFH3_9BRAS